jgi:hypothetical protein
MTHLRGWLLTLLVALTGAVLIVGCELDSGDGEGGDAGDAGGTDTGGDVASCTANGLCEPGCGTTDPDCTCDCDNNSSICNAEIGTSSNCACDPQCTGSARACANDGVCDSNCVSDADPDCGTCDCDRVAGRCDAAREETRDACSCDTDCSGDRACQDDGDCDEYCLARDDDCPCDCNYYNDICEAESDGTDVECDCDPECDSAGNNACTSDGHCDNFCDPSGICKDPDCDDVGVDEC